MKKKIWIFIGLFVIVFIVGGGLLLYSWGVFATSFKKANNDTLVTKQQTLPIPPLLEDKNPAPNKAEFEITARDGTMEFFEGIITNTRGYNGNFLGPVIRVRTGEEVSVKVTNELDESTTLHWHGLEVDGENDGGPHNEIKPGETWNPMFTINQPAATLWYHPHQMHKTGKQVYEGMAGLFYIEDEVSDSLKIPKEYGVNDVPLIIQDRRFDGDGQLDYELGMKDSIVGFEGHTILVNGAVNPFVEAPQGMMRLRILNGSNGRIYNLKFSNGQEFYQIASDGGFLEKPVRMDSLTVGSGERAEILVDFSKVAMGETVELQDQGISFMSFVVNQASDKVYSIPEKLTTIEKIDERKATTKREFNFQGTGSTVSINGVQMDMDRIDEEVNLGSTEIWEVGNFTGQTHPFHAHGVQFQILDRNGNPPPDNEAGWKDTFLVKPGENVRVIATFKHEGIFMYHCHILEHEDAGMMGQFLVEP